MSLTIFDAAMADCESCELRSQRDADKCVPVRQPVNATNGLMLIGEGPGRNEVLKKRPFVGKSGNLLDALLDSSEIDRDATWVTNATLCQPPFLEGKGASFHERHPTAVPACLPRLEAELKALRPRVVVTLGNASLIAATGYTVKKARNVPNTCTACDAATRKVGPGLACAKGDCDWFVLSGIEGDLKGDSDEAKAWADEVREQCGGKCPSCSASIRRIRPRALKCPSCGGKKTMRETFDEWRHDYKISEVAGAIFEAHELPSRWDRFGVRYIIPTFHPSFCLRPVDSSSTRKAFGGQFAISAVRDHLDKARRLLVRDHQFDFRVTLTDRAQDLYDYAAEPYVYEWDVETNAKSPWDVTDLRCIGIGRADREEVLVLDTRGLWGNVGTEDHHRFEPTGKNPELVEAVRWFLTSDRHPKVAQNGPYDCIVAHRIVGVMPTPIAGDTKVAHHVLRPDEPHDLQPIAFEMSEAVHWKPPKTVGGVQKFESFGELALYNGRDVRATSKTHQTIAGVCAIDADTATYPLVEMPTGVTVPRYTVGGRLDLPECGLRGVYDVDTAVMPIALEMEATGIPIHLETLQRIAADIEPKHAAALKELEEWSGLSGFNPGSTKQLQYVLFDPNGPFKLTATAKTATGQASTAADELAKLSDHPFVRLLLDWREWDKTLGTYIFGKKMIIREDGCIHPSWNTTGARTGRWSSSPNFQNWPEWLREAVQAPPGWSILGADYAQLELRIMAALSGDAELMRRCMEADESDKVNPDKDPHSFVASVIFGAAFLDADSTGRKLLRQIVKACIYGMNYGAGPAKVREAIYKQGYQGPPITVQQVTHVIAKIFEIFPGVEKWRESALHTAMHDCEVRSAILHRWRNFPGGDVEATVAWNFPIQSTAADIINLRILALRDRIRREGLRARFMAQVHDAVYMLAPDEEIEATSAAIGDELTVSYSLAAGASEMVFAATPKHGKNWMAVS